MKEKVFKVFNQCVPIKGANRAIIYDLNRNDFDFIPNEMVDFINISKNLTKNDIIASFGKENEKLAREYFEFLEEKEYIYWIDENEIDFFPEIGFAFDYPCIISNSIIEVDIDNLNLLKKIILDLKAVHCHHVCIIIKNKVNFKIITSIIDIFFGSNVKTIHIILQWRNYTVKLAEKIFDIDRRIIDISIMNSDINDVKRYEKNKQISFLKLTMEEFFNYSHKIVTNNFRVNIYLFSESLKYNTYYNKKVSFSKEGFIKNSLFDEKIYGNILHDDLKTIVETKEFQSLWNANKDKIKICKDCEFRYMCVDSCPLKYNTKSKLYERTIQCNYCPYKNIFYE